MAKTLELKRRIRSIGKTRQITRTMEMVSTSKLKRATDRVHAARPYAARLTEVIGRLIDPELRERYPLLRQPETVRRAAVILVTSNRGLAGAFNVNLIREARRLIERLRGAGVEVEIHVVGKKAVSFFRYQKEELAAARSDITDKPTLEDAMSVIEPLREGFEDGRLDEVYVVHAQFRSALSTPPATVKILPVSAGEDSTNASGRTQSYILSPSADEILNRLLPLYVRNSVYRALVETAAAEHGARRTAMKNATDNAGDILDNLNRTFNRARQAQITQEIAEIVGGAAALE
ncbi:MAG TPA: ATP synthase F1 subunit gamma [Longimicrobiales bacterium]|jgi:F-type H+-transporting ATPase subunit gamma|nr:ATP synthase F1 subunit gamma [Longimicrobiales bacterium]